MARDVRQILFEFIGNSKSLEQASGKSTKALSSTEKAFSGITKAAGALGVAFGAQQVLRFAGDATEAASTYAESVNAVQVATGDASAAILQLGETAATELGLSKNAVNEAAVAFSAFGEKLDGPLSDNFETFIGRATDFASVMNLDVNDALEKFRSGLAGESEPLRKFGIDLSAAAVSAYAVEQGISASASSMTEAEKVQARYGLLLKQTNKFAGDFANTSDSLANQQRIANAEFENAKIAIGEELLPVQLELVKAGRVLIPMLADTAKEFGSLVGAVAPLVEGFSSLTGAVQDSDNANWAWLRTASDWARKLNPVTVAIDAVTFAQRKAKESAEEADRASMTWADHYDQKVKGQVVGAAGEIRDAILGIDEASGKTFNTWDIDEYERRFMEAMSNVRSELRITYEELNDKQLILRARVDAQVSPSDVVDALQTWNRNNGAVPIEVRTPGGIVRGG